MKQKHIIRGPYKIYTDVIKVRNNWLSHKWIENLNMFIETCCYRC